jgi:hypothetical protein
MRRCLAAVPLLIVPGLGLGILALGVAPWTREPGWDEAIYLSQVGSRPELPLVASRSRGVVVLAAPLLATGAPLPVLRVAFTLAAAFALVLALRCWWPLVGAAAGWAGALFATAWTAWLAAPELMPNLWAALLGLAALGLGLRAIEEDRRDVRGLLPLAALAGLAAFVRPLDAIALLVPLLAVALRRGRPVVLAVGSGVALGAGSWFADAAVRTGGLDAALSAAARAGHLEGVGLAGVRAAVALADGPTIGTGGAIGAATVLWVALAAGLVALGLRVARRGPPARARAALVAVAAGATVAAPYLLAVRGHAPRFLLPAYACWSIPAGIGLAAGLASRRTAPAAAVLLVAWAGTHVVVGARIADDVGIERAAAARLGRDLRAVIGPAACSVEGRFWPQVAYAAGCRGTWGSPEELAAALEDGARAFVVVRDGETPATEAVLRPLLAGEGMRVLEVAPSPVLTGAGDG